MSRLLATWICDVYAKTMDVVVVRITVVNPDMTTAHVHEYAYGPHNLVLPSEESPLTDAIKRVSGDRL